ncbi:MAG: glycoside hydrolase family 2 TIM barrel-domain containing protein [Bacillota bacterium]|nr:glycoside hydrolase family 2 TIM barrel-domain containing protein [Bacillota bacterium]
MNMNMEWIADPRIFQVNRLDPKAYLKTYRTKEECAQKATSLRRSLNGTWKFEYAQSLESCSKNFYQMDVDCSAWDDIQVPGHIQCQGYGNYMYVNQTYPWSGSEEILPGQIPKWNPVGSYVRTIEISEADKKEQIQICFHGVESAFALWVNGEFIGYSESSFDASYFDLSNVLRVGSNKIALQVYRFSSGSWIEDQDFFRFSGIFRDVELVFIPKTHLDDLKVTTPLFDQYTRAQVVVDASIVGEIENAKVNFVLMKDDEVISYTSCEASENLSVTFDVVNPNLWSAEKPNLYELIVEVVNEEVLVEITSQHVGIREFKLDEGLMKINGKRIVFHGVNRHEFSPETGRVVGYEQTKEDLLIMKDNNINALRTSHYPNQTFVYNLCDELGLYCIDEVNLETHGTWQGHFDLEHIIPRDEECWLGAILDRAKCMLERDKNHPSIIIWSCGNESFGGKVIWEESEYLRHADPTRLVHYESLYQEELLLGYRTYPATSDMESQMYTPADECAQFIEERQDKPFLLCEYSHAMGNSNGGLFKYTDMEETIPRYQGGFIWDFVDQAMYDKDGILRYGGDFKDRPSDYDFCGDGIVFADRTITPKMQEVKYCYQYVLMDIDESVIKIKNNYLFTNLNEYTLQFDLYKQGQLLDTKKANVYLEPGKTINLANPFTVHPCPKQIYMIARVMDSNGHEVAHEQYIYENKIDSTSHAQKAVRIVEDFQDIGVIGEDFSVKFHKGKGLTSYKVGGEEMIRLIPRPNFYRPQTNNDVECQHGFRYAPWLPASMYALCQFVKVEKEKNVCKVYFDYQLPNLGEEKVHVMYTIYGDGEVVLDMDYQPVAENVPMPAFGMMFNLYKEYDTVKYFGYGPDENHIDRNKGALLGEYKYKVVDNVTPYLYPQECGNRTNVQIINVSNGKHYFEIRGKDLEFSALPYTPFEIENARHHDEFPIPYQTVVCVYETQMGVGGDNTWGARVHDEFLLANDQVHHLSISIRGK